MNSIEVLAVINRIAATASKNEKQAFVASAISDRLFEDVVCWAYNPFLTYGVTAKTLDALDGPAHPKAEEQFDDRTRSLIDALAKRTLSGNAALDSIAAEFARLDFDSGELLYRILIKDLRAGFSESTINKAKPGTIPEFPYMRCSLPDKSNMPEWDWTVGIISQEKADGMFANMNYLFTGEVAFTSRQGTPLPPQEFEKIADFARQYLRPGAQYHGELVVHDQNDQPLAREISNGMLNAVANDGTLPEGVQLVYHVWDVIPMEAVKPKGKESTPYKTRLVNLLGMVKPAGYAQQPLRVIKTKVVRSKAEAYAHYKEFLIAGKEGTVCKHPDATWKDGTSKDQVKLKLEVDVDLKITAVVPGRAGTKNEGRAGSLTCQTSCGGLVVDVTVKNEVMRDQVDAAPGDYVGQIIVVRSNSIMPPSDNSAVHSLFLPRMVEANIRTDKALADTLEQVRDQFRNAVEAA